MDIALNGFKATGLCPCDGNVIKVEDFVASVHFSNQSNEETDDIMKSITESGSTLSPAKDPFPSTLTLPIVASPTISFITTNNSDNAIKTSPNVDKTTNNDEYEINFLA